MPIWLTNADQLRSAHAEPGSQSNQPQSHTPCSALAESTPPPPVEDKPGPLPPGPLPCLALAESRWTLVHLT